MATELPVRWEKLKILSIALASLLIPLVVAYMGNSLTRAQKNREIGLRYVELAIGILRSDPMSGNKDLRVWAVEIVDHYSSAVPLSDKVKEEFKTSQVKHRRAFSI